LLRIVYNEGEARFAYTCGDCSSAVNGTVRYAYGKLQLSAGDASGSYLLRTKPDQLCFEPADRAKPAGSGTDAAEPPLPAGCWSVR